MTYSKVLQLAVKFQHALIDLLFLAYCIFMGYMMYETNDPSWSWGVVAMVTATYLILGLIMRFVALAVVNSLNYIVTFGQVKGEKVSGDKHGATDK